MPRRLSPVRRSRFRCHAARRDRMSESTPLTSARAAHEIARVRAAAPLVHCLTNSVVTPFTANVLLACGCAPAMVVAREEVAAFAAVASALSVNVGTLDSRQAEAILLAVHAAAEAGTPWTLDPVAVGALAYRTAFSHELLAFAPAAIRGNASEIIALAGLGHGGRGVDSTAGSDEAVSAAVALARRTGAVVAVTGATDYITDGERLLSVANGHPLLQRVTGTGCSLSALVAASMAGAPDRLHAAASACAWMAIAGEQAAEQAAGPGSFAVALLDALAGLDAPTLERRLPA